MSYLFAILGLGVLIVVHELGHMLVARRFGMRVDRFSVGFGPPLVRYHGKQTTYQIAAVPLGGFVQIAGMNPHEELPEGDPGSYANKPPWARAATIMAGPLTNYLFAIVIMSLVFFAWGYPVKEYQVAELLPGDPAARGGMQAGDRIVAIDGHKVEGIQAVLEGIKKTGGKPARFTVLRDGKPVELTITPRREDERFVIGIQFGSTLSFSPMEAGKAVLAGLYFPVAKSHEALSGLAQVFSGKVSTRQVGGPLEIVRQLKLSFQDGLVTAIIFLGMLNVYLGLFNLLPVPALDGGRLVFLLFTLVTRRPVNQRIENAIHTAGFFLLLGLILLLTYRDAARLISQP